MARATKRKIEKKGWTKECVCESEGRVIVRGEEDSMIMRVGN